MVILNRKLRLHILDNRSFETTLAPRIGVGRIACNGVVTRIKPMCLGAGHIRRATVILPKLLVVRTLDEALVVLRSHSLEGGSLAGKHILYGDIHRADALEWVATLGLEACDKGLRKCEVHKASLHNGNTNLLNLKTLLNNLKLASCAARENLVVEIVVDVVADDVIGACHQTQLLTLKAPLRALGIET